MGLFDWFRRRHAVTLAVFLDEASRSSSAIEGIRTAHSQGANVLVIAHFEAALLETGRAMAEAGIEFTTRDRWTAADTHQLLLRGAGSVTAVLARSLPTVAADAPRGTPAAGAPQVCLQVVDLHVLASENDRITRFADSLAAPTRVAGSLSFDSPIMAVFAKPWVKTMMVTMGQKPGEAITSPMVTRGVMKALRKLEDKAFGNVPCPSIGEWMQRNLPPQ